MDRAITFRAVTPQDEDFLCRVYASTRMEELAQTPWSEPEKEAFLRWQFAAQSQYYRENYARAEFQIILRHREAGEPEPIGRLYVERREQEIRIMDIALLPAYRNQGIGSSLLKDILAEGERSGKPVTIHVECFNPALRLYRRLGFRSIDSNGLYSLMEWTPHAE